MWYATSSKKTLDYTKPIIAERDGEKNLLLPRLEGGGFKIKGYDWFNITLGTWNSCYCWPTACAAVAYYKDFSVYNVSFKLTKF